MATQLKETTTAHTTQQHIKGIDYIELYVGNAQQAAFFYCTTFGFTPIAYAGPETGVRDHASFVIAQGDIRLVLSAATTPHHPIAQHVSLHGDGVKDIAFTVDDVQGIFEHSVRCGAHPASEPRVIAGRNGQIHKATIGVYGDIVHSFIQRDAIGDTYLPQYQPFQHSWPVAPVGLHAIDHVASCIEAGNLELWVQFYKEVFDFQQLHEESVATEYSAMNSKAVRDPSGRIKFVIMEPAPGKRRSQIEDYLLSHGGPGAQHFAVSTNDIVTTVRALRAQGIQFRSTPGTYYDMLEERVGRLDIDVAALRDLHILVDRDDWGYLLQIFAKPVQARPTLFCEIIQREGARGFGSGNIKALFESIEREQTLSEPV